MACSSEFIEYVCDALKPLGEVRSRKMMGDYVIYVNDKCVITACDNLAFVKKLPCIAELMADAECGCPYPGAKEAYILDFANTRNALKVIATLWQALPYPKQKRKSQG
ncbi:MAG: transcriptional regulator [Muribaculaceae bacterium]|nr:transcriptional regulator [Muribaculaceae bacterium]